MNGEIDKLLLKILKDSENPISTYKLAKKLGISWATVNVHCYKLMSTGRIKGELKESISGKKMFWWIDKK